MDVEGLSKLPPNRFVSDAMQKAGGALSPAKRVGQLPLVSSLPSGVLFYV
jgi:hypothetical protein